jgi:hypothetical protein
MLDKVAEDFPSRGLVVAIENVKEVELMLVGARGVAVGLCEHAKVYL